MIPSAYPSPEWPRIECADVQVNVPACNSDKYILHVYERVQLNLPVVPRSAATSATETHTAQYRFVVNFVFLVRSKAIVQQL